MAAAFREGGPSAAARLLSVDTVHALALVATPDGLGAELDAYAATGVDELAVMLSGNPSRHVDVVHALAAAQAARQGSGEASR
jgi:hypothetical protein